MGNEIVCVCMYGRDIMRLKTKTKLNKVNKSLKKTIYFRHRSVEQRHVPERV